MLFNFFSSSPHSHLISLTFPFVDTQLSDSPSGCGRVQHCFVAQKPGEEPQHGCSATWSRSGLPGYDRRGEQQLHQRCSRWQLPSTGCFHCDPSPSAGHHSRLLEAGLWLWLHGSGHAQPTQPVELCMGKVKVLCTVFWVAAVFTFSLEVIWTLLETFWHVLPSLFLYLTAWD